VTTDETTNRHHSLREIQTALRCVTYLSTTFAAEVGGILDPLESDLTAAEETISATARPARTNLGS
jgi:hypothetical protein